MIETETLVCPYCGRADFKNRKSLSNHARYHKGFKPNCKGKNNNNWKGGKRKRDGYILIYKPTHPFSMLSGYIYEHRLIMEQKLNRYLTKKEVIHHIDNNKENNAPKNLQLFKNKVQHSRYHAYQFKK